jgi:hypothetical protein
MAAGNIDHNTGRPVININMLPTVKRAAAMPLPITIFEAFICGRPSSFIPHLPPLI